jgi:methyl acetate hydrolase
MARISRRRLLLKRCVSGLADSYYGIDPKKKVAGVFTTQLFPYYDAEAVSLFNAFETAIYEMA